MLARSNRVVVDLGTGDGRSALRRARLEPDAVVFGIDASAAAMAEVSRRAARPIGRGGQPNAVFVVAAAERPPAELVGLADEVTVLFPWGSLLRGVLGGPEGNEAAAGIAGMLKPGGRLTALVSVTDRDAALGMSRLSEDDTARIAAHWAGHGLCLTTFAPATAGRILASGSTWARRLLAGGGAARRPVWHLEARASATLGREDVETGRLVRNE